MRRGLRRLTVVHPFPSVLDAGVVAAIVLVAGGGFAGALLLGIAMLGFQCSIGALNDVVDARVDAIVKPGKPIPSGLVSSRAAGLVVVGAGSAGLLISATFGAQVLAVAVVGYGCGLAYDLGLKANGWGWLAFAVAIPCLVSYAWLAGSGQLPPRAEVLLPIALLAGPMLHLSNSLVDLEGDRTAGYRSLAVRLGRRRGLGLLWLLLVAVYGGAWLSLLRPIGSGPGELPAGAAFACLAATATAAVGGAFSGSTERRGREAGWSAQAIAAGLLATGWLAATVSGPT